MNIKEINTLIYQAMKEDFNDDKKKIDHANKIAEYAEELLVEEQGDYLIVIVSALLHDIGIHEAARKYNSRDGKFQEKEGPPIALEILSKIKFPSEKIE